MAFFGKFGHIQLTILYTTAQSQYLMVIGRNGALNTVCQSCRFSCQQKVLKTFSGPDYLRPRMSGLPMAFRGKFGQTDTNMAGGRGWGVGVKALKKYKFKKNNFHQHINGKYFSMILFIKSSHMSTEIAFQFGKFAKISPCHGWFWLAISSHADQN